MIKTHLLAIGIGLALFATPSLVFAESTECNPGIRPAHITFAKEPGPETTELPADLIPDYNRWLAWNCVDWADIALDDYDYQGAFMSGIGLDDDGLFPDTFEKHSHVLFSVDSKYSTGLCDGCIWQLSQHGEWECLPAAQCLDAPFCGNL